MKVNSAAMFVAASLPAALEGFSTPKKGFQTKEATTAKISTPVDIRKPAANARSFFPTAKEPLKCKGIWDCYLKNQPKIDPSVQESLSHLDKNTVARWAAYHVVINSEKATTHGVNFTELLGEERFEAVKSATLNMTSLN